jgi:hypothetical protein
VLRVEGDYANRQFLDALEAGLDALGSELPAPVLVDARASTASRPTSEVRELATSLAPFAPRIERVAVVVSSDVHYGLARMGAMLAGELGASSDVFRDMDAALAYLDVPDQA